MRIVYDKYAGGLIKVKIGDAIDAMRVYHPAYDEAATVDSFKTGDARAELRGIVTTCSATVDVIRQTATLGYNLIICHEPTFYNHRDRVDWLAGDEVYSKKRFLCDSHGIAVWRHHDRMHNHIPDAIYTGVMMELGWEAFKVDTGTRRPLVYDLPKTTVRELAAFLKRKLELETTRVIGDAEAECARVIFKGGGDSGAGNESQMINMMRDYGADALVAGELVDWAVASYARDAAQLGIPKAVIHLGHLNSEELGMKHYASWLGEILGKGVSIRFIRSGDPYQYV